jgi:hypothetical protein
MANLRVGYDAFAGSSQAGTDSKLAGILQAETAEAGLHRVSIERLSDNEFYNASTKAFVASRPAEALELAFEGSDSDRGIHPAIRRLMLRLPKEAVTELTAAGCICRVYAVGNQSSGYAEIDLNFLIVTA